MLPPQLRKDLLSRLSNGIATLDFIGFGGELSIPGCHL
jgi:hypothetical protein